ncbi:Major Facilitator Superfamily (MFS) transporter, partial [Phytophthora megakarya]
MPAGSLMDHAVLDMIEKVGGEYGKQRLFGAVGWGTGAYITGLAVAAAGISWAFNISLIFMFASLLVLRTIPPVKHSHHHDHSVEEGGRSARQPSFADNMRRICQKKDVIMLLLVVFFMGLMYGVLSSFLALNLFNLSGGNAQIVGIAIMCETISELPAFFFSHTIIKKLGTVKVLLVSITAYALRITYYAVMTNAWSAIPFEFLHGCTFGLAWAACTQYIYAAAPKGCEGTVMGLLNATQNGLARAVGTMVGGYFYQHHGARVMWAVTDMGVPLALIFLAAFAYLKSEVEEILSDASLTLEEALDLLDSVDVVPSLDFIDCEPPAVPTSSSSNASTQTRTTSNCTKRVRNPLDDVRRRQRRKEERQQLKDEVKQYEAVVELLTLSRQRRTIGNRLLAVQEQESPLMRSLT